MPKFGVYKEPHIGDVGNGETMTAQDIILAPGSVPLSHLVWKSMGETVYTSDEGLELKRRYCAIIGSGIIGLESFAARTSAAECTVIEALYLN